MTLLYDIECNWEKPGILLGENLPDNFDQSILLKELEEPQKKMILFLLNHSEQRSIARIEQAQAVGDYPLSYFDEKSTNAFKVKAKLKKQTLSEYIMWALNLALDTLEIKKRALFFDLQNPQDAMKLKEDTLIVYGGGELRFNGSLTETIFAFVPPVLPNHLLCSIFVWNGIISISCQGPDDTKLTLLDAWSEKLLNF